LRYIKWILFSIFISIVLVSLSGFPARLDVYGSSMTDDWPMYGHDLNHTAYSTSEAPNGNTTLWIYTIPRAQAFYGFSPPAVAYGRVYATGDSHIYCFNATSGEKLFDILLTNWSLGAPTIDNGKIYVSSNRYVVGNRSGNFYNNGIYCLNAVSNRL